jgi:aflatoxin B1 aldehyde reductase
MLDYFQSRGYNEVDTSRFYINGQQEAFTRKAQWKERGLKLATKHYPSTPGEHLPEKIRAALETSLRELGTDTVDIFYLHAADRSVPFDETLREVDKLYRERKFKQLGLSNFAAYEVAEVVITCKANGWVRPTIYQGQSTSFQLPMPATNAFTGMYNAITRSIEPEVVAACRRYGLNLVIYNPLAGGLFSGKYDVNKIPEEGRFSNISAGMGASYRNRYFKDATFDALRLIQPVAEKHDLTLIETALRWVLHHSALKITGSDQSDGILIGVSNFDQLKVNLEYLEKGPLPEEVVKALDEAWAVAKSTAPPYWHGELKYTYNTEKALFG